MNEMNPLLAAVKTKAVRRQSTEVALDPEPAKSFDTTTPAAPVALPRRFQLGDLPRYEVKLFPVLQKKFPHLNNRMYGGWLRGCIADNECLFICTDNPGAVAMAHIVHKPMNPVPLVEIDFLVGSPEEAFIPLYAHILKWAHELGAPEVHFRDISQAANMKKAKSPYVQDVERVDTLVAHINLS